MRKCTVALSLFLLPTLVPPGSAECFQAGRPSQRERPTKKSAEATKPSDPADLKRPSDAENPEMQKGGQRDGQSIKLDTTLVSVPVIASDRNLVYVPDMRRNDFTLFEDGVQQQIVFFATTTEPFRVVLMLDTSASTEEKLPQIQRSVQLFVEQLQPKDQVKVISFDDEVRDHGDFTSDRAELQGIIHQIKAGKGTKLYDAVHRALTALRYLEGRKAIVLFTDGVDWHSHDKRSDDNIQAVDESEVIVYPIRYDTRADTEALLRRQERQGQAPNLDVTLGGPSPGGTPPTVPDTGPDSGGRKYPWELPVPPIIGRTPRTGTGGRFPDNRPDPRLPPDARSPNPPNSDPRYPDPSPSPRRRGDDPISAMLDTEYARADRYLNDIAAKSGGKLHRADTLASLPAAFARIAAELRTQYTLGYYSSNPAQDGSYRKIQVRTSRKNVMIRARPGYRAPGGVPKPD